VNVEEDFIEYLHVADSILVSTHTQSWRISSRKRVNIYYYHIDTMILEYSDSYHALHSTRCKSPENIVKMIKQKQILLELQK
jgi:hypothetical protein